MSGATSGGVWTHAMELAGALELHGVEVVLAGLGGPLADRQRAQAVRIPNLHVIESGFQLDWMNEPWEDLRESGRWLLQLEADYSPDVVHLNSFGHGSLKWHTPVVITAHHCVLSWWMAAKGVPAPADWNRYRLEAALSVECADRVTAPTRAMARNVEMYYGQACSVVPNGRSAGPFRSAAKEPFILTAGRLDDEGKNISALTEVAPQLPWPLYVAGAGEDRDQTAEPCRLLGQLREDEMADWYSRASIFALPARYEPFGYSILEAALSGCALVLGDIDSLRENWDGAAVFVAPHSPRALRAEVESLIEDTPRREQMAERAAFRAMGYTPERMARNYMRLYRTLVVNGRRVCTS